jgi:hypothetical protein
MNISDITLPAVDTVTEVCGTSKRMNVKVELAEVVKVNRHDPADYVTLVIEGRSYFILHDAAHWPHLCADTGTVTYLDNSVRTSGRSIDVEVGQKVMIDDHDHVYTLAGHADSPHFARC